jgi:hypothetical protein
MIREERKKKKKKTKKKKKKMMMMMMMMMNGSKVSNHIKKFIAIFSRRFNIRGYRTFWLEYGINLTLLAVVRLTIGDRKQEEIESKVTLVDASPSLFMCIFP